LFDTPQNNPIVPAVSDKTLVDRPVEEQWIGMISHGGIIIRVSKMIG
jgi:hypothetical protein